MYKMKKAISLVVALALLIGVFLTPHAQAQETGLQGTLELTDTKPQTTALVVHKLQADKYNANLPFDHNGGSLTNEQLQTIGTNVKELDGVTFSYYKVSEEQLKTMKETPASYDTVEEVNNYVTLDAEPTGTITTSGEKGASVNLAEGYYWFVESGKPATVSSSLAVPFGISLPLTSGSQYLSKVHVYPKNVTGEEPVPDKTVDDLANKYSSHNVGDTITWYLQGTVPANIKDYQSFTMSDRFSNSLSYKGNVVVKYGAQTKFEDLGKTLTTPEHYTITQPTANDKGGELKIDLTQAGIKFLADHYVDGGKVIAKIETVINEDAIMGLDIPNAFTLTFQNNPNNKAMPKEVPTERQPKVITGGKRFKKVSGETALPDAIFQLFDGESAVKWTDALLTANKMAIEAGQFATKEGDGTYKATSEQNVPKAEAEIYLRSKDDGTFEIKGLELSSWTKQKWDADKQQLVDDGAPVTHKWNLKEVKAPAGYGLLDGTTEFTVDKNSYFTNPTEVAVDQQTPATPENIENKKLTIPQTGGMGTALFIAAGVVLIGAGLFVLKKNNRKANA